MQLFKSFISIVLLIGLNACASIEDKKVVEGSAADIYLQLGVRYLNLNKLEIARENLQHAIQLDHKNAQAFNAFAFLDEKLNKIDEARSHYQTAIALTPDDLSIKNNYGRFLCEHGDAEKGMALLNAATIDGLNERPWLALTIIGSHPTKRTLINFSFLSSRKWHTIML